MTGSDTLQAEVRCGFNVTKDRKKIWSIQLDLLKRFCGFCAQNNLTVFAWAGTMLGAVRHQGFIPWDDDIDVAMTRSDFEKLLEIANNKPFDYPYFLQTPFNDKAFFFGYARFRNSNTTGFVTNNISKDYNNGIFIDIFVLDEYPKQNEKKKALKKKKRLEWLLALYKQKIVLKSPKAFVKRLIQLTENLLINYDSLLEKYERYISSFSGSGKVGLLTHPDEFIDKYWCFKEDVDKGIINLPFEDFSLPVLANYDSILRNMYGDYMQYPPIEKRGTWHNDMIIFDPDIPYTEYYDRFFGVKHEKQ